MSQKTSLTLPGLAKASVLLLAVTSLAGWFVPVWPFELCSHFPLHQAALLVLLAMFLGFRREWRREWGWSAGALVVAAVHVGMVAPAWMDRPQASADHFAALDWHLVESESGETDRAPLELEAAIDQRLMATWAEHGKAIVIAPEVDVWLWGSDNALRETLNWPLPGPIRDWLRGKGFQLTTDGKPLRPKEALDAMRAVHKQPRSSAMYEKVTSRISLARCNDAAFVRLRKQLRAWFEKRAPADCNLEEPLP